MNRFDYLRAGTVAEAVAAGAEAGTVFLAGGTNLVDLMKGGVVRPSRLVDLTRLPGLDRIERLPDGGLRIGALVRNADLAHDPHVAATYPALAEALLSGASAQLRNAATAAGNVLQRTRCAYFADPASACNKRNPGAGCDARGGETRQHAVLGWSERCIATHPSDFCVALAALDAVVEIEGRGGRREVALDGFHRLPGEHPDRETVLEPGDLIVALRLPPEAAGFAAQSRYLKVRERTSYAFAVVSVCAGLRVEGERIAEARIALGGVAHKPWRAREAEALLAGADIDPALFRRAGEAAMAAAAPSGDNAHKITLAARLVARTLARAAEGRPSRLPALPASVFPAHIAGAPAHV
ncbi:FAD binding domain-containing protein [Methylobacterium isbiliense]|uniref:Aldehyde oxidoreductase FAD-binding subunit PaoB n=1 Tax=Methylobacterium isbiliense TaxID=315478 RepID=A0ABQ4SD43_9HYPH|nr:xanthine dehydrogenase family protein subunit M [Methylobacterium isbiliense]MDN3622980.1 xanthine dehydrogenase family protein subunit M [Methylobacterium isbiliense]GJE00313.1 Aldehyde oxidoreductase FAD-binding subunit PaoB [Methylobacterium isbiliense]